ncbi:MAG: NAD(P)/FAD-dependent oxidoreductase [Chloroflexi bacterium]|nr:NAD(P)/FAD-dependent oxidoreductase [Chloroflexota bacterium]
MTSNHVPVVIIGAGPAGLTAAYELAMHNIHPLVLEKADKVGGIARTEVYKGYHFDIGGHRFFTKIPTVQQLWEQMLGPDFHRVHRLSRIYYRGHFFYYPLNLWNTLSNLGLWESVWILLSYIKARLLPAKPEDNFERWVSNRFGWRLYQTFFQTYTEKVWGIPCHEIQAEWAAQRIHGLSLTTAVLSALFGTENAKSLIHEFYYPTQGPGMMWQRFAEAVVSKGGQVWLQAEVVALQRDDQRVNAVLVNHEGKEVRITVDQVISSMPLRELVAAFDPPPPDVVREAAQGLHYRDFILVGLILNCPNPFPDNWLYIHSPEVQVGRIQNFRNWSQMMVPDAHKTSLGLEYFCNEGDALWSMPDQELVALAARELNSIGLASAADVEEGVVFRQRKAYPVYDRDYRVNLAAIRGFLATVTNLQTIGRNGMHRYNNMDHSMLTGMLAARNVLGEQHDLWKVNTEQEYYE